jgi:hypothetical protein
MKDRTMRSWLFTLTLLLLALPAVAVDKKPIEEVDTGSMARDAQTNPTGAGEDHISLAWWIPKEYWEAVMSRDNVTPAESKKELLKILSSVSLLAVVQGDVSEGTFDFYSKEEVDKNLRITFSGESGKKKLMIKDDIEPGLRDLLEVLKPILAGAMGNMGQNMHFYVIDDRSPRGRVVDPYAEGIIEVELASRDNQVLDGKIELPINSLFVPRKCPNGKEAHISWKYCPWTGEKLEE